jgi:hypothetical protein
MFVAQESIFAPFIKVFWTWISVFFSSLRGGRLLSCDGAGFTPSGAYRASL